MRLTINQCRHAKARRGVTPVEVLLVVLLVGVAVALLVMGILHVRAGSQTQVAKDRLRGLGVTIQVYQDAHQRLPTDRSRRPSAR